MSASVFVIILISAALHATWNAIVKVAGDKLSTTAVITASASLLAVVSLPFLPSPDRASWPFIIASVLVHVVYFSMIVWTYRLADMSRAYPLMRGSSPLIVAVLGFSLFGERLAPLAWIGMSVLCLGIVGVMGGVRRSDAKGVAVALGNGVIIASYTLVDGIGVRRSGSAVAYTLWVFMLTGIPLTLWRVSTQRALLFHNLRHRWHMGVIGGAATIGSYGLALWAMVFSPVAVVAALREVSVLFGAAISVLLLKERFSRGQLAAVCTIMLGVVLLRLA